MVREAVFRLSVAMRYYNRPRRARRSRNPRLELALSAIVVVAILVTIVVFLLIYHDFPLRVSGQ